MVLTPHGWRMVCGGNWVIDERFQLDPDLISERTALFT